MRPSGRFNFFRHVLYLRSYKIIFVNDVTSYGTRCEAVHFMLPDLMFLEILCSSSRVDLCSSATFLIFVLFVNGCLKGFG